MLRNTTYIGEYACNKRSTRKKDGKTIQRFKDESEWIRIPCEAIIDKDIFMRAQDILDKAHTLRRRGESHLFTGLIKCGECGRSFNYYKSHRDT